MNKYHVTYFYLASGMEGMADTRDYGFVNADNEKEAKDIVAKKEYPKDIMYGPNKAWSTRDFLKGCLKAELVTP